MLTLLSVLACVSDNPTCLDRSLTSRRDEPCSTHLPSNGPLSDACTCSFNHISKIPKDRVRIRERCQLGRVPHGNREGQPDRNPNATKVNADPNRDLLSLFPPFPPPVLLPSALRPPFATMILSLLALSTLVASSARAASSCAILWVAVEGV